MKAVKVLGSGCANCKATARLIEQVAADRGVSVVVEKVEKMEDIARFNVMATPGVVIDGVVVHSGGIPARSKVEGWF
ncbi:MAG: thioredoxin family protein [Gemmatimonadetes bacterium]|nr:thioredoxin family protein [Gemmatimonadota bacterium]